MSEGALEVRSAPMPASSLRSSGVVRLLRRVGWRS